jgi:hypothetical protein
MRKIEVNEDTLLAIALGLFGASWWGLTDLTDMPILMFFVAYMFTFYFMQLCRRYVIKIRYNDGSSSD